MSPRLIGTAATLLTLCACSAPVPRDGVRSHLNSAENAVKPAGTIPEPVEQTLTPPRPRPAAKAETYSVVVNSVSAHELLFALAREAKLNVDIHPGVRDSGNITLNAIDQTLPQLLSRIAKQIDIRFELDGPNLTVMPDTPFLRHYKVDYVNLSRTVTGTVGTNTQITTGSGGSSGGSGNVSNTRIENASKNQFWESLEKNIKDLLRETDKEKIIARRSTLQQDQAVSSANANIASKGEGAGAIAGNKDAIAGAGKGNQNLQAQSGNQQTAQSERDFKDYQTEFAANVIMNPESGTITIRATSRQQEKIQEFLDRVINSARRQVMIETTIIEVELGDGYEQGIDWTRLIGSGTFRLKTIGTTQNMTFNGTTVKDTAISLLQTFGTAKVLSSPRVSVLNNQTALLKVVENVVYFTVKADTVTTANVGTTTTYTTTPQTVSVGLVLTVTPQISDSDNVTLNIRPTITSLGLPAQDPNPDLKIANMVPQIRTREIESVMRVASGDVAVLGGLMKDSIDYTTTQVPVLGQIPLFGEFVTSRINKARKSELVIFIRPIVIKDANINGDFSGLKSSLPGTDFFKPPTTAEPLSIPFTKRNEP